MTTRSEGRRVLRAMGRGALVGLALVVLVAVGAANANRSDPRWRPCMLKEEQLTLILETCGQVPVCPAPVCPTPVCEGAQVSCPEPVCPPATCTCPTEPLSCPAPVIQPPPITDFHGRCKPMKNMPGVERCRGTFWRKTTP